MQAARGRGVAGFANALLRRLARQGEPPLPDAAADPAGYLVEAAGLPDWLATLLLAELPAADALAFAASIAERRAGHAAREHRRASRATRWRRGSPRSGRAPRSTPSAVAPDALVARRLDAPAATQAWREGLFAIADAGAQVVAELCGAAPGERILDACAGQRRQDGAPAGAGRRSRARRRARRRRRQAGRGARDAAAPRADGRDARAADLTQPLADPTPRYHRILLDAPCSGLGVLRRHPEALRGARPPTSPALAAQQLRMLTAVAPALLPGRRARLRGLHLRAPRVRGRRRGLPARPSRLRAREARRRRAAACPGRGSPTRRAPSGPGRSATTRTRSSPCACAAAAVDADETVKVPARRALSRRGARSVSFPRAGGYSSKHARALLASRWSLRGASPIVALLVGAGCGGGSDGSGTGGAGAGAAGTMGHRGHDGRGGNVCGRWRWRDRRHRWRVRLERRSGSGRHHGRRRQRRHPDNPRIMPLGDSTTASICYRAQLWQMLHAGGADEVRLRRHAQRRSRLQRQPATTRTTRVTAATSSPTFSRRRGRACVRAAPTRATRTSPTRAISRPGSTASPADIVLMHFGTNDVWNNIAPANDPERVHGDPRASCARRTRTCACWSRRSSRCSRRAAPTARRACRT